MKNTKKFYNGLFIFNLVLSAITLITIIYVLSIFLILPLPERVNINLMSPEMIKQGQGIAIVSYEYCFYIILISWLINIIVASFIAYLIFSKYAYKYFKNRKLHRTLFIIYAFFNILLPFLFSWFSIPYWNKTRKMYVLLDSQSKQIKKFHYLTVGTIDVLVLMAPFVVLGINQIVWNKNVEQIPYKYNQLKDSWTLSASQPNTMVLYFDRGTALLFNLLLALDYVLFKDENKSFAQLYPEFTSYINSLSIGIKTNGSVPNIGGGWFQTVGQKDNNEYNNLSTLISKNKIMNSQINLRDWFYLSYLNQLKLMNHYGYNNLYLIDPMYYGNRISTVKHNNSPELNKRLKNDFNKNVDVESFDQWEVTKALGYGINKVDSNLINFKDFGARENIQTDVLQGIDGEFGYNVQMNNQHKLNLRIDKNKTSSFLCNYVNNTHEVYQVVHSDIEDSIDDGINNENPSEGNIISLGRGDDGLWYSSWYTIQKLKNIFSYLKNLPYYGPNSDVIKNQYDNTNIYIISDHGNFLNQDLELRKINDILIENNLMTESQSNYLIDYFANKNANKFNTLAFNSLFIRKPRKYIHSSWNKQINENNILSNLFDQTNVLTLADFIATLDSDMQKVNQDLHSTNLEYKFDISSSYFKNIEPITNFVLDPLNNLELLNNRIIPLYDYDWVYQPSSYKYNITWEEEMDVSKKGIWI